MFRHPRVPLRGILIGLTVAASWVPALAVAGRAVAGSRHAGVNAVVPPPTDRWFTSLSTVDPACHGN